jgi:glycosyltransferase involved in cell wall biosynthesis
MEHATISLQESKVRPHTTNGAMLLVLPVPFLLQDGGIYMEAQASNGVYRWLDGFDSLIIAAPAIPEELAKTSAATIVWKDVSHLRDNSRVTLVPLPWACGAAGFARTYRPTRELLKGHMRNARYLQFAIGGLVGDWAAVAALEAIRQGRRFAIHTDRVEHQVHLEVSRNKSFLRRVKARIISGLMFRYHRHLIRRCSLGLWHGSDCYDTYSPFCKTSYNIHDVHTKPEDCIDEASLQWKLADAQTSQTVSLCYAGRLDPMKAPLEWLKAVAVARDLGAPVRAVWLGDGPLRGEMESEVQRLKLADIVDLPGFVGDRNKVLSVLRKSHMMLFTHVTKESPRCLLESLISGTPIVGYQNKFAGELTSSYGGGAFTPIHDWETLGKQIALLASDRYELRRLITEAARNGQRFNDAKVFAERSELILKFC